MTRVALDEVSQVPRLEADEVTEAHARHKPSGEAVHRASTDAEELRRGIDRDERLAEEFRLLCRGDALLHAVPLLSAPASRSTDGPKRPRPRRRTPLPGRPAARASWRRTASPYSATATAVQCAPP